MEVFRSADQSPVLPPRFGAGRLPMPYCTSIYYLVESPDFSAFHRIKADELWYFHAGTGITVHVLAPGEGCRALELGPGAEFFGAVGALSWFAAEPSVRAGAASAPRAWGLVSCAVSPGFDYRDFELADRAALCREFPERSALIERLTRE
jgi:uncharacterized protein